VIRPERTATRNAHELNDESLLEAVKGGQATAFATLSERYRHQLFRAAHRITRSSEDAEDAVQDTLLRAFVHMREFEGRSNFGTWLTRIAINSALMILRKKRAALEIAMDYDDEVAADGMRYGITDQGLNPERRYARSEEERILKKAIHRLRPTLRVVVQIQLQERSMRETAQAIGISLTAAKGRLFHAKKALRRSMTPKLAHHPRFASEIVVLARRNGKNTVKGKKPRKGTVQRLRFHDVELRQDAWPKANPRTDFGNATAIRSQGRGHEYVIETKEKRNYRVPSELHSGGGARDFSRELGA